MTDDDRSPQGGAAPVRAVAEPSARAIDRADQEPWRWPAVVLGAAALLVALAWPRTLEALPLGYPLANLAIVVGLYGLLRLGFHDAGPETLDRLVVVLAAWLPVAVLVRLLYMDPGATQGVVLRAAAVPEGLTTGLVLALAWAARQRSARLARALTALGLAGAAATVGLLTVHVVLARPLGPGAAPLLVLTALAVVALLALQWIVARRAGDARIRALAAPAGLAVAAGHLLDGVVSYLAVVDPLGLLPRTLSEGVLVSRAVLENAGPLFPLLKWALAAAAVAAVAHEAQADEEALSALDRVGLLVLVLFAGMGPGLYSATRVLYL